MQIKKLKIMDVEANKLNIEKIAKVRDHLINSTVELNEEEVEIALAIIELGTNTIINNQ